MSHACSYQRQETLGKLSVTAFRERRACSKDTSFCPRRAEILPGKNLGWLVPRKKALKEDRLHALLVESRRRLNNRQPHQRGEVPGRTHSGRASTAPTVTTGKAKIFNIAAVTFSLSGREPRSASLHSAARCTFTEPANDAATSSLLPSLTPFLPHGVLASILM